MALKTTTDSDEPKKKSDKRSTEYPASSKSKRKILEKNTLNELEVHRRTGSPIYSCNSHSTVDLPAVTITMSTFYPQYQPYSCPIALSEWGPIIPVNPLYTVQPIPIIVNPTAILSTQICPYVPPVTIPPVITPLIIPTAVSPVPCYFESVIDLESSVGSFYGSDSGVKISAEVDGIEYYLSLPKELFPSARMMMMDPNKLIDEFCRLANVNSHASWMLDLEFGIPKSPITRHIPSYNVKFNSIHCKNTPDAIHPGFESCSQDFKRELLFYYDCIVSAWYRGYVFLNGDRSVENFQSWLSLPMQMLGMCWP